MENLDYVKLKEFEITEVEVLPNYDIVVILQHKESGLEAVVLFLLNYKKTELVNEENLDKKLIEYIRSNNINEDTQKKDFYLSLIRDVESLEKNIFEGIY